METAPKGGGADDTRDPKWVEPPKILLKFEEDKVSVAYWDWYYAKGGRGFDVDLGYNAWIEPCSGEMLSMHYDDPIGWMEIPQ